MTFNGKPMDEKNFFPNFDLSNVEDTDTSYMDSIAHRDIEMTLKESNSSAKVPFRFHTSTFDDYPSDIANAVKEFCLNPKDGIFILSSAVGCGKTTLLCSAIHERALNGLPCGLYFSDLTLDSTLRTCRSFSAHESESRLIDRLSTVPFLVIDEYGACGAFEEEWAFVSKILRLRYDNELPTIIATNLSPNNFFLHLAGIDPKTVEKGKAEELVYRLSVTNATINRVKSISKGYVIAGTSHRGAN